MQKYKLEKSVGQPLYEALYRNIKDDIMHGRLKAGDKLPSKREMALDNNISLTTVLNAYQQLLMEGYLISSQRRGYFVADIQSMPAAVREEAPQRPYYQEIDWFADFLSNNTLYHYFPYSTWKKVVREILTDYETELVARGNPFGIPELRAEIASFLYRTRGISTSPECIIIGAGIEYLYARLITLFPPNTIYSVENPGYRKISQIYSGYNLRWKAVEMDSCGVSMADLLVQDVNVVHVSPEHHYPLGTIMPMSRRQELLAWAQDAEDRYIIEDDFDCEFRYSNHSIPALKSLDTEGKVIYMNTFSKTLSPAIRISYMVLPEEIMERYIRKMHFFTNSTSSLEQYTLARFIRKGYFERHLNRIKKIYRQEGETLWNMIRENPDLPIRSLSDTSSGTHLLLRLNTSLSDAEIKQKAAALGVNFACLTDYCFPRKRKYPNTLILNFSDLSRDTQQEGIRRLGSIFAGERR